MDREIIKTDTGATFEVSIEADGTVTARGAHTGIEWTGGRNALKITGKSRRHGRNAHRHALGMGRRCVLTIDTGEGETVEVKGVALDPA